jgi:hypothetical protein
MFIISIGRPATPVDLSSADRRVEPERWTDATIKVFRIDNSAT